MSERNERLHRGRKPRKGRNIRSLLNRKRSGAGSRGEYQVVINPVVLGRGRTMFDGIKGKLTLKLTKTQAFANGNVLLCYAPMA